MCGVFGWAFNENTPVTPGQRVALATALAISNDRRGGDSWGWLDGRAVTEALAAAPTQPLGEKIRRGVGALTPAGQTVDMGAALVMAGHTRKATVGAATVANAHPFEIGGIVGMHNGVISNHVALNAKHSRSCAVDSMHIFEALAAGKPLDELFGYGTIAYMYKDEGVIRLCQLQGGDLAIYGVGTGPDDSKGVIWSSDEDHLVAAIQCAGIQAFRYRVDTGAVYLARGDGLWYATNEKYPTRLRINSLLDRETRLWGENEGAWEHYRGYHRRHGMETEKIDMTVLGEKEKKEEKEKEEEKKKEEAEELDFQENWSGKDAAEYLKMAPTTADDDED